MGQLQKVAPELIQIKAENEELLREIEIKQKSIEAQKVEVDDRKNTIRETELKIGKEAEEALNL